MSVPSLESTPRSAQALSQRQAASRRNLPQAINETQDVASTSKPTPDSLQPSRPVIVHADESLEFSASVSARVVLQAEPARVKQSSSDADAGTKDGQISEIWPAAALQVEDKSGSPRFVPAINQDRPTPTSESPQAQNAPTAAIQSTMNQDLPTLSSAPVPSASPLPALDYSGSKASDSERAKIETSTVIMISLGEAAAGVPTEHPSALQKTPSSAVASQDGAANRPNPVTLNQVHEGVLPASVAGQTPAVSPQTQAIDGDDAVTLVTSISQQGGANVHPDDQSQGSDPIGVTPASLSMPHAGLSNLVASRTTTPSADVVGFPATAQTVSSTIASGLLTRNHGNDSGEGGKPDAASGPSKAESGHDDYGDSQFRTLFAAIVGGTFGAIAVIVLSVFVIICLSKKRRAKRKRDSMTLYSRRNLAEKKDCQSDRMEKGLANHPAIKRLGVPSVKELVRRSRQWLWQKLSQTKILTHPLNMVRSKRFPGVEDEVVLNTSTDSGQGTLGRRRAASAPSQEEDFRIGMDLNLQSDSEFNPFSDNHETEPQPDGDACAPSPQGAAEEPPDTFPHGALQTPPLPQLPPSPPPRPPLVPQTALTSSSLKRLRSQSLGVHRLQLQSLSRIQEPNDATNIATAATDHASSDNNNNNNNNNTNHRGNKFHSDPFDLEFRSRLQSSAGPSRASRGYLLSPSSSRYTFGPSAELPHIDSYVSRPMSGFGHHDWVELGQEIRNAMMGIDDSSTLRSDDSCYSGERTTVEGARDA